MRLLSSIASLFGQTASIDESRWIMLDVETSGLDTKRDSLIAIAAIALRVDWQTKILQVDIGDSFEILLNKSQHRVKIIFCYMA